MFAKLRHFCYPTVTPVNREQQQLDNLRYRNADNQMMQLHLDRMQTALDTKAAA